MAEKTKNLRQGEGDIVPARRAKNRRGDWGVLKELTEVGDGTPLLLKARSLIVSVGKHSREP